MKVCFLTTNFPPEVHAGTEMAVGALGASLLRRGVEVVVVTSSDLPHDGADVLPEDYRGMRVVRLKKHASEWDQTALERPRLIELVDAVVAAERPDLLHVHAISSLGIGHVPAARARGIPTVMTFHDLWVTCARYFRLPPAGIVCPTSTDRRVCAGCVNLVLRHPDENAVNEALKARDRAIRSEVEAARVLTAPSATAARTVRDLMPAPHPVEVVPHGLLEDAATLRRVAPPLPGERLRIGTFGNLVEQKGVLELVRAMAGVDAELHLGGSYFQAEFGRQVRELARQLDVDLVYHGPYGPGTPHPAEHLHLAVFPSKCQETYGLVVDEALARGVPTIVSDNGALAERAVTGGVVVAPLSSLPAVVHDLARDRDRLRRLAAAVPNTLPTIDQAAARYLELYALARDGSEP